MTDKLIDLDDMPKVKRRRNTWCKHREATQSKKCCTKLAIAATNRHAANRPITLPALSCLSDDD